MKKDFPPGMEYEISYDVSTFLNASIDEVIHTLRDAFRPYLHHHIHPWKLSLPTSPH